MPLPTITPSECRAQHVNAATNTKAVTITAGQSLVVFAAHYDQFLNFVSVTYNGVAMAFVGNSYGAHQGIWFLENPAVGTHNVVVTISSARWMTLHAFPINDFNGRFRVLGGVDLYLKPTLLNPYYPPSAAGDVVVTIHADLFQNSQSFAPTAPGMTLLVSDPTTLGSEGWASASAIMPGASPTVTCSWSHAAPYAYLAMSWTFSMMEDPPIVIANAGRGLKWAKVPLPDPETYYNGYAQPRLESAGKYMRAIADRRGEHELSSFEISLFDTDRMMLIRAGGATSRYMQNRTMIARTNTDEGRRALTTARTLAIGLIRDASPETPWKYNFRAEEYLTKFIGSDRDEAQIPKRRHSREYNPSLPSALVNKPEVIWYGDLTSGASETAPPKLALQWIDGGFYNPNIEDSGRQGWHLGWGSNVSTAAVPTNINVSVGSGGSINTGEAGPYNLINVAVTAVDSLQRESSPRYFNWHQLDYPHAGTLTGNGQSIAVTWSASAGAIGYRVYFGYGGKDTAFMRVQTLALGITITKAPVYGTEPTEETIDQYAELIEFAESWIYGVSAIMPDGQTVMSNIAYGKSQGYRRPLRISWAAVTGATGYYVYRRTTQTKGLNDATEDSVWDRRWAIPPGSTDFDDDLLDTNVELVDGAGVINGMVPLVPFGTETSLVDGSQWFRFLIGCHACKEIRQLFVDEAIVDYAYYGKLVLVPGHPGYTNFFADTGSPQYLDLGGRRYCVVYARGDTAEKVYKGEMKATANIKGIESRGDGRGTLLEHIPDQYLHFMLNFGIGDWQTGDWEVLSPLWPNVTPPLRVLDVDSFYIAKKASTVRYAGGYVGAGGIGTGEEFVKLTDVIRDFNLNMDGYSYVNARSQFSIGILDMTVTTYTNQSLFTQQTHIKKGSFKANESNERWENYIPYKAQYIWSADKWMVQGYRSDATSIENYQETKKSDEIELKWIQNAALAAHLIDMRLERYAIKPWEIEFECMRAGINEDVNTFIAFQHAAMVGTNVNAIHLMHCERLEFDGDQWNTRLSGLLRSTVHIT